MESKACWSSARHLSIKAVVAWRRSTRQSLKVDPRGPAISNLHHPYPLLPRTDRARMTKTEMVIKQAARARILTRICEFGAFIVAHLSEWVLGRSGEARGPKFEKHDFRNRRSS